MGMAKHCAKVGQKMSSPGVSFRNCGSLTTSERRLTLMDYHVLPAEVKSWILTYTTECFSGTK
jgi:hypothetical protein